MKIRNLTRTGLLCALSVALLYATSFFHTLDLTITAIAGMITAVAMIHCGTSHSIMLYIATALLGLLILPNPAMAVLYAMFFGYYPIVKHYFERIQNKLFSWGVKLLWCNFVFCVLYFLASRLFDTEAVFGPYPAPLVLVSLNVVFVIFDIGMTRVISYYIYRKIGRAHV